jgi:hypothetical protein
MGKCKRSLNIAVVIIFTVLMLAGSASALAFSSSGKVSYYSKVPRSCYFDVNQGTICPGFMSRTQQTFREDPTEECYFDKTRGAVCPHAINVNNPAAQTASFRPRAYTAWEDRARYQAPARISSSPPMKITGGFHPRFAKDGKAPQRFGYSFSDFTINN